MVLLCHGYSGKVILAPGFPPFLGSLPSVPLTAVPCPRLPLWTAGPVRDPVSAKPLGLGSEVGAGPPPAWLGLQGKANLLVEPGGFHIARVVVLDPAEEPDPLLGPLDFQWGRREGWGGMGAG